MLVNVKVTGGLSQLSKVKLDLILSFHFSLHAKYFRATVIWVSPPFLVPGDVRGGTRCDPPAASDPV